MRSSENVPAIKRRWLIIYVLLCAELIALLEIFSFPFFSWASRISVPERFNLKDILTFELFWAVLFSSSLRINLIVWELLALLAMFLSWLWLRFFRKAKLSDQSSPALFFGLCLAFILVFAELILVNQAYSGFSAPFKTLLIFSFLVVSALLVWLIPRLVRLVSVHSVRVLSPIMLTLVGFFFFNFFRIYFQKATRSGVALTLALFFILVAVILIFSWFRREKAPNSALVKFSRTIMILFLIFSIFPLLTPAWQWRKVFLPFYKHSASPNLNLPNLIMIVLDTARADHFSFYGYSRKTTPFLEQLVKDSVVFENAYATAPWTLPSHASFFTGVYPSEHNCHYENMRLAKQYQTLAEDLSQLGYFTLGYSNNELLTRFSGLTQGFDRFVESPRSRFYTGEMVKLFFQFLLDEKMYYDNGARRTGPVIKKWLSRTARWNKRYFLFINYMEAHIPYPQFPEAFKFFDQPETAEKKLKNKVLPFDLYNCHPELSPETIAEAVNWYDGALYYLDRQLEELFAFMARNQYLDNTIVIILSDHGESLGEHQLWGHAIGLYQQILWVPLIIYAPSLLKPARVKTLISLKEIPAILKALLQGQIPSQLQNPEQINPEPRFAEVFRFRGKLDHFKSFCPNSNYSALLDRRQKAVLLHPYKLIWDSKNQHLFFNLEKDPQELNNLYPSGGEALLRLNESIKWFLLAHPLPGESHQPLDPQTLKALKALGYIH